MPTTTPEHISIPRMERFCARVSDGTELIVVAEHLATCENCHRLYREVFARRRDSASVAFALDAATTLRHEHLAYEQLVMYAEQRFGRDEREMVELHLSTCGRCREDVADFLRFREQIEPEMSVSYAPTERKPRREQVPVWFMRSLPLGKPAYAALAAVAVIAVTILLTLQYEPSRSGDQQARQVSSAPQHGTPANTRAKEPSAAEGSLAANNTVMNVEPRRREQPDTSQTAATQPPGAKNATPSRRSDQPTGHNRTAEEELLAQNFERPGVLSQLAGESGVLRGDEIGEATFELLSPARAVIAADSPTFTWKPLPGATSYRVHVADLRNREVAGSGELPASSVAWTPSTSLERGEVYTWAVIATVGDDEIISPAPTAAEMRFKVLSAEKKRELELLQKNTGSHLARGVFYAREGMLLEAERELNLHLKLDPRSPLARKLLRAVRSWR